MLKNKKKKVTCFLKLVPFDGLKRDYIFKKVAPKVFINNFFSRSFLSLSEKMKEKVFQLVALF